MWSEQSSVLTVGGKTFAFLIFLKPSSFNKYRPGADSGLGMYLRFLSVAPGPWRGSELPQLTPEHTVYLAGQGWGRWQETDRWYQPRPGRAGSGRGRGAVASVSWELR